MSGLLLWTTALSARADFGVAVSFNDAAGTYASYDSMIVRTLQADAAIWSSHLTGTSGTLRIQVNFDSEATASSASTSSYYVGMNGATSVYEQGALAHITNGFNPTNSSYDAVLNIGTSYLTNELWFDPNPSSRTAPVPTNKTDAVSVFLHEMTHELAFNGFTNGTNGTLPGSYESTFDQNIRFDGTNFYYVGARAEAIYGGPVALTYGNIFHVGNNSPRPGADLIPDLMNGVVYYRGQRYDLSALDLAMVADTGAPVSFATSVPEPGSIVLVGLGMALVAVKTRRLRRRCAA